jgi:uncharacterized phage-associated protein
MLSSELFNERKASQAAAYFLYRAGPAMQMPVLKLMKLLYLAERRSFERYCEPMIGDRLVSMPHGPVLSITYNHMNGELDSVDGGWDSWIGDREGHDVAIKNPEQLKSPEDDLLELSDSDLEILNEIWNDFGHMSKYQIRDYTHKHCPEWKDPRGSMIPMTFGDLFRALEFSSEKSEKCIHHLQSLQAINMAFEEDCA